MTILLIISVILNVLFLMGGSVAVTWYLMSQHVTVKSAKTGVADEPKQRVNAIRLKDDTILEYVGDEVPEELVRLVDDKYWITER